LDRGPAALSALAVRIGLGIRLPRRWVTPSPRMVIARATRRRRPEDDMSAPEHSQRPKFPLSVSNFFDQIGNPEDRRQRERNQDPNAELIPLNSEERHRHDKPPDEMRSNCRAARSPSNLTAEPAASEPVVSSNV